MLDALIYKIPGINIFLKQNPVVGHLVLGSSLTVFNVITMVSPGLTLICSTEYRYLSFPFLTRCVICPQFPPFFPQSLHNSISVSSKGNGFISRFKRNTYRVFQPGSGIHSKIQAKYLTRLEGLVINILLLWKIIMISYAGITKYWYKIPR
jgi:hypothetical protein